MKDILRSRYSGWFKAIVLAINPDKDELEGLMGEEMDEPEYVYSKRDGTRCIRVDIYLQDVKTEALFKHSIFLEDKDDIFESGTRRYINQSGKFQITDSEDNLFNNFTNFTSQIWEKGKLISENILEPKKFRVAKVGEYELMHFSVTAQETFNKNGDYLLDMEKIFEGDLSSLNVRLNEPLLCAHAYVDNGEDHKQKINKNFMKLLDFQSLVTGTPNKYNSTSIRKWEEDWSKIKEDKIYRMGRLDNVTEEDIPKIKELNDDDSEY